MIIIITIISTSNTGTSMTYLVCLRNIIEQSYLPRIYGPRCT